MRTAFRIDVRALFRLPDIDGAELDRHVIDGPRESERQLVSEVDRGTDVHADVEPFAERELNRDGLLQASARDLLPVRGQADLATFPHAAAVVLEVDNQLRLSFRQRLLRGERHALDRQEVVDEGRLAVAEVQAVSALEAA